MQFQSSTPSPGDISQSSLRLPNDLPTAPTQLRTLVLELSSSQNGSSPRESVGALISLFERLKERSLPINPSVVGLFSLRLAWQLRELPYHDRAHSQLLKGKEGQSIFDVISAEVWDRLATYQPSTLVQVVRAFAVVGVKDKYLFREISRVLGPSLRQLSADQRSHIAWAYATLDMEAHSLFKPLVQATKETVHEYSPVNIATTLWSFARLGIKDRQSYYMMLDLAKQYRGSFSGQCLANMAWAQAESGVRDVTFLETIADDIVPLLPGIHRSALPYVVWSYASLDLPVPRLFDAVLTRLSGHIGALSPLGIERFVWAISRVDISNEDILSEAAHSALDCVGELRGGALANLAWGFSNLGYRDDRLFRAIAHQLLGTVDTLNPQMLINVIWAYGNVGFSHEELFAEFCQVLKQSKEMIPAKLYATAVWSISNVHPEMLVGLACREDLERPGYDVAGWIQLYNALLLAGVLSTTDEIPAYEGMVERMRVSSSNGFELDVERTIRDILADRPHTIEAQKVIGGVVTDWYVEVDGKKFAIECDGRRYHVLLGPDGGVDEGGERWVAPARDYAQDKVLRLFGVTPIHVLSSTFYAREGDVPTLVSALRGTR